MRTSKLFLFAFGFLCLLAVAWTAPPAQRYGPSFAVMSSPIDLSVPIFAAKAPCVAICEAAPDGRWWLAGGSNAHDRLFAVWNQPGQRWRAAANLGFFVIDPHIAA